MLGRARTFAFTRVVVDAGPIDVLVVNLMAPRKPTPATDTTDEQWLAMFDA